MKQRSGSVGSGKAVQHWINNWQDKGRQNAVQAHPEACKCAGFFTHLQRTSSADSMRRDPQGEAAQVVNQAKGNAQARVDRAQGEANRFVATLKEYNQAKDIITKRIYIETMEEILPNIEKIIIDGKTADRMLPYLPLDRIKAKPGATVEGQNP